MNRIKQIFTSVSRLVGIAFSEDRFLLVGYFLTSFLGVIFLFGAYFAYALLINQIAKTVTPTPTFYLIVVIVTYLFFEYFSRLVYSTVNQYYFDYLVRSKFQNALTRMFMAKLADLDFAHLENGETRNLIAKVEDTFTWRVPENLRTVNNSIYSTFGLILAFAVAFQFNFIYFIILALASAPLYYLRAKYSTASWSVYTGNAPKTNFLWYMRNIFVNYSTLSEMKIYQLKSYFLDQTEKIQAELINEYRKPITRYTIYSTATSFLIPVVIYLSLINFVSQIGPRGYNIGQFTFFLNTLFTFSNQISNILFNIGAFYENSLFVQDYFNFLSIKNIVTSPPNPFCFSKIEPVEIKFVNVSFQYPSSPNLSLNNISLTISKKEDVAIVGHNGAGKTTLIKLLLRFYDPTEGTILINGTDLRQIDINNWYKHIGVLFQDFAKYDLSLKENIEVGNIGNKNNVNQAIDDAISQAQAEDVVEVLKHGKDQTLGRWFQGGQDLSTGQWQKIAIARALYRNAPVLILDEPTSNIDAESEYKIFQNLKNNYKNKSLIFISHRFSTVRMADRIIVLEKGQIVESGTHEQLIRKNGYYAKYFTIQKRGYE